MSQACKHNYQMCNKANELNIKISVQKIKIKYLDAK